MTDNSKDARKLFHFLAASKLRFSDNVRDIPVGLVNKIMRDARYHHEQDPTSGPSLSKYDRPVIKALLDVMPEVTAEYAYLSGYDPKMSDRQDLLNYVHEYAYPMQLTDTQAEDIVESALVIYEGLI